MQVGYLSPPQHLEDQNIQRLQKVQNGAARLVDGAMNFSHAASQVFGTRNCSI